MAATGRPRFGIRLQLLGLFGLLLLTGAAVLALDEYERRQNQQTLLELKDDSLAALRQGEGQSLSPELVQRLMLARARCMQQQQAVHRATASFGRTLGMLFPGESTSFAPPATHATARALQAYR